RDRAPMPNDTTRSILPLRTKSLNSMSIPDLKAPLRTALPDFPIPSKLAEYETNLIRAGNLELTTTLVAAEPDATNFLLRRKEGATSRLATPETSLALAHNSS
ncbi:MAG TPA: hypothetical protein VNR18_00485, partial [Hyphomicrobiales bacterium]|nr:hypothetical protein [Hyphomicrobiales bacterium]